MPGINSTLTKRDTALGGKIWCAGSGDHTTMFGEWEEGHTIFSDIGGNEGANGVVKADVNHRAYVRAFIHVGS